MERKLGSIHTISRAKNAGGTVYGNWRPQFLPAPELSTSFQETMSKKKKMKTQTTKQFQL
jgi:hypothetical protein